MKTPISKILVVGSGAMGSQIAMLGALGGYSVALHDIRPEGLAKAAQDLRQRMARNVAKGRMTQEDFEAAFERLLFTSDLSEAAANADLVIEAIIEDLDAKESLYVQLIDLVPKHTIFASNTSSIVGSLIGRKTDRPEKFVNMHFFNPPLVMQAVEIAAGDAVAQDVLDSIREVCQRMGKSPVFLDKEIPGLVANRIVNAIFREAISLYEEGYASVEAIDELCKKALAHPMGPFELLDMAGIDVNKQMQDLFYLQTGDPDDCPQDIIVSLVKENRLGRKTGSGFYEYTSDEGKVIA